MAESSYHGRVMNPANLSSRYLRLSLFLLLAVPALAKDVPIAIIDWPATGTPVVRFTFSKFKQLEGMSNMRGYVMDTTAQNLSPKLIPSAKFSV
jgi:hypothetical protein